MKKIIFIISILLLLQSSIFSQWVSLDNATEINSEPKVTILEDSESSTTINVKLSGFYLSEVAAENKTYQKVDLLNEIFITEAGMPEVPYVASVLAIPDDAAVEIEVISKGRTHKFENINLAPARESWWEGAEEPAYVENSAGYRSDSLFPEYSVSNDEPAIFRDFRIARVAAYPVKYNAAKKELEVTEEMTIKVNYLSGRAKNPKTVKSKGIAPSFGQLYRGFLLNYESVLQRNFHGEESAHDIMLVITPDDFYDDFQVYANWRNREGIQIFITKFSEIGANSTDPQIIKDHIANAYTGWDNSPTHILLVGDYGIVPRKEISYDYTFAYENFFVELEGNDYFPEMMIGRFTNQGNVRLNIMINKFLLYQQDPVVDGSGWLNKAITCSNDAYPSQAETKRFTAKVML